MPHPFGHVDVAPPTGFEPASSSLTGWRSDRLSYGSVVRALGLEPSLFRGKSPVPHRSGVTRMRIGVPRHGRSSRDRVAAVPGTSMLLQLSMSWYPDW